MLLEGIDWRRHRGNQRRFSDIGKLLECLWFTPDTEAVFLAFGAPLEQAKDGQFLVSATVATTWIQFASAS
jgi:hypothetical protein